MKTIKENVSMRIVDEENAAIEAMRVGSSFAKVNEVLAAVKQGLVPAYWDILYDCLKTGGLMNAYRERWAKDNYLDISNIEVKNDLLKRFAAIADPYDNYRFPQKFVKRNEDGSFDRDDEAINAHYRAKYTYTFSKEEVDAINGIAEGLTVLGINPAVVSDAFFMEGEKVEPSFTRIGNYLKSKK